MRNDSNVTVAAFLRPRGILLALGCVGGAVLGAILAGSWMFLLAGFGGAVAAYGWSVYDSLNDHEFIEYMSRKALSADVSSDVKLEVLARTGGHRVSGPVAEEIKKLASSGKMLMERLSSIAQDYGDVLPGIQQKITDLILLCEDRAGTLCQSGMSSESVLKELEPIFSRTGKFIEELNERVLLPGTSGESEISAIIREVEDHVGIMEDLSSSEASGRLLNGQSES
jgi:hypothetical protein